MTRDGAAELRRHPILLVLPILALSSCGTEDKPPAPDDGDLYPLAAGDVWLYRELDGAQTTQVRYEVTGLVERDFEYDDQGAVPAFVVENTFPSGASSDTEVAPGGWRVEYIRDDGTRAARLRHDVYDEDGVLTKTRDYVPGFLRFDRSRAAVGAQWAEETTRYTDTLDGSAVEQEVASYIFEVLEPEVVSVPAGTFQCTVVQRTETFGSSPEIKRYYFAAGVGKVKEITGAKIEELVSYQLAQGADAGR
jgi:hypothetical protein